MASSGMVLHGEAQGQELSPQAVGPGPVSGGSGAIPLLLKRQHPGGDRFAPRRERSEEHTSELQSQ